MRTRNVNVFAVVTYVRGTYAWAIAMAGLPMHKVFKHGWAGFPWPSFQTSLHLTSVKRPFTYAVTESMTESM